MKPNLFRVLALCVWAFFSVVGLYAQADVVLFASNQMIEIPEAVAPRPGIEYDRVNVNHFNSMRAKFPSALLSVKSYGTPGQQSSVAMDGGFSSHTGLAVDGMSVESGQSGGIDASILPVELAETADVYKNNLLPFGMNAPAGLVNFNLPDAKAERSEISAYGGSYSRYGGKAVLSRKIGEAGFLLAGSLNTASNNFDYTDSWGFTNQAANLDYTKYSILGKAAFDGFGASVSYTSKSGGTGARYTTTGRQKDDLWLADLNWTGTEASAAISYVNWLDHYEDVSTRTSENYYNQTFSFRADKTFVLGQFSFKPGIGNKLFLLDGSETGSRSDDEVNIALENIFKTGPFQADFAVNGIARKSGPTALLPGLSASYELFDFLKMAGSVSRIAHFPAFNDLYWPEDGFSKGNPNLKPEDGWNWKTGLVLTTMPFMVSAYYSQNSIQNLILWSPKGGKWMPDNIGIVLSQGVSLEVFYENFFGVFYFRANGSFSMNAMVNNDLQSRYYKKRIIYMPLYKSSLSMEVSYLKSWGMEIAFRHASERFTTEDNTAWLEPYYVADIRLFWEFLYLSFENVLDAQYQESDGYPQMGRSIIGGIDYKF